MEKFRETFYLIYGTCRDGDSVIHGDDQTIVATKGAKKEVRKVFDVVERSENARANTLDRRHFYLHNLRLCGSLFHLLKSVKKCVDSMSFSQRNEKY